MLYYTHCKHYTTNMLYYTHCKHYTTNMLYYTHCKHYTTNMLYYTHCKHYTANMLYYTQYTQHLTLQQQDTPSIIIIRIFSLRKAKTHKGTSSFIKHSICSKQNPCGSHNYKMCQKPFKITKTLEKDDLPMAELIALQSYCRGV